MLTLDSPSNLLVLHEMSEKCAKNIAVTFPATLEKLMFCKKTFLCM